MACHTETLHVKWLTIITISLSTCLCDRLFYQEPNAQEAAITYLKQDFVNSLLLRVELVREKIADDDAATGSFALRDGGEFAFPKRASLPCWPSSLGLCAHFPALLHVFQDEEKTADNEQKLAVQNALEILGSKESGSSSEVASLAFLESDSRPQQHNNDSKSNKSNKNKPQQAVATTATAKQGDSNNNMLFIALAVLLVLLAIVAQQLT